MVVGDIIGEGDSFLELESLGKGLEFGFVRT